uniref:Uncharacterized protein n=1 Tax=Setaria italica TaxID=4555 RepID=K3Y098_SETIT
MIQEAEVLYLLPVLYSMMQPLMFFHNFRCTLVWFWNTGPCSMSNVLGVDWQIRHEDCNLLSAFGVLRSPGASSAPTKAIGEEDCGRTWIDIVFSLFQVLRL